MPQEEFERVIASLEEGSSSVRRHMSVLVRISTRVLRFARSGPTSQSRGNGVGRYLGDVRLQRKTPVKAGDDADGGQLGADLPGPVGRRGTQASGERTRPGRAATTWRVRLQHYYLLVVDRPQTNTAVRKAAAAAKCRMGDRWLLSNHPPFRHRAPRVRLSAGRGFRFRRALRLFRWGLAWPDHRLPALRSSRASCEETSAAELPASTSEILSKPHVDDQALARQFLTPESVR